MLGHKAKPVTFESQSRSRPSLIPNVTPGPHSFFLMECAFWALHSPFVNLSGACCISENIAQCSCSAITGTPPLQRFWLLSIYQSRFDNKHTRSCLASRGESFWVGVCGTRGQGPPAQWFSLLFDTPEGSWRLSCRLRHMCGGGWYHSTVVVLQCALPLILE